MLRMGELVDEEYNIEYAFNMRLEELLVPDRDQSESSDKSMVDILSEDDTLDEEYGIVVWMQVHRWCDVYK